VKRDDRGQLLPIAATILAAAALAGALVTAMVAASASSRSKALAAKATRESFTLPLVFVDRLAKDGPVRACQDKVLAAAELTGEDGYWRYDLIPAPEESTGDAEQDRVMVGEWKAAMRRYIESLRPQLDGCDPALRTIDKSLLLNVVGPATPGCLGYVGNDIFVSGPITQPTITYNFAGASRKFSGVTETDGSFAFELAESRNIGADRPAQHFDGNLRGVLRRDGDGVTITDGAFSGIIDDGRGTCSFAFTAEQRAQ
jgi:hypothetical protein